MRLATWISKVKSRWTIFDQHIAGSQLHETVRNAAQHNSRAHSEKNMVQTDRAAHATVALLLANGHFKNGFQLDARVAIKKSCESLKSTLGGVALRDSHRATTLPSSLPSGNCAAKSMI